MNVWETKIFRLGERATKALEGIRVALEKSNRITAVLNETELENFMDDKTPTNEIDERDQS